MGRGEGSGERNGEVMQGEQRKEGRGEGRKIEVKRGEQRTNRGYGSRSKQ